MKETMKKVLRKAPPPEWDDKKVYRLKCDKGDTNYRYAVTLRNHETMQHKELLRRYLRLSVRNMSSNKNILAT